MRKRKLKISPFFHKKEDIKDKVEEIRPRRDGESQLDYNASVPPTVQEALPPVELNYRGLPRH